MTDPIHSMFSDEDVDAVFLAAADRAGDDLLTTYAILLTASEVVLTFLATKDARLVREEASKQCRRAARLVRENADAGTVERRLN